MPMCVLFVKIHAYVWIHVYINIYLACKMLLLSLGKRMMVPHRTSKPNQSIHLTISNK